MAAYSSYCACVCVYVCVNMSVLRYTVTVLQAELYRISLASFKLHSPGNIIPLVCYEVSHLINGLFGQTTCN